MGYLGFLFEMNGKEIVVFVLKDNITSNIVVGIKEKVILSKISDARFLSSDLSLKPFPIFDSAKFLYGKISVSKTTFVDYKHMTMWFGPIKYRKLRQLFDEKINDERELVRRALEAYDFFR